MEKSSLFKVASVSKESSIEETTVTSHAFPVGSSSWKSFSGFNITVSQLMAVGFFSCWTSASMERDSEIKKVIIMYHQFHLLLVGTNSKVPIFCKKLSSLIHGFFLLVQIIKINNQKLLQLFELDH